MTEVLRVGGGCGFWGETSVATAQLLSGEGVDVIVYDYLAEITMSVLARARQRDTDLGYARDFVDKVMADNLEEIAANGVRILSNAGGVNPRACADALEKLLQQKGISLTVAVVEGDDLMPRVDAYSATSEMFTGAPFPRQTQVLSMNAYLGAGPIVAALDEGADIIVTGRCVDSALTLAACMHQFGWAETDFDLLAAGSLAGHLLECGPQASGGNFTDWEQAGDLAEIGYPIIEMQPCGTMTVTKPIGTAGIVSPATVGEQMLYEIGDPQSYDLPDVICDFAHVTCTQSGAHRVAVQGAKGRAPSDDLKVSVTWQDGFRAGYLFQYNGIDARLKATEFARIGLQRTRQQLDSRGMPDFSEVCIETFGGRPGESAYEEISLKAAVRHETALGVGLFLKELIGAALAAPPGLHGFTGAGRPKPSPVVSLFSCLVPKSDVKQMFCIGGRAVQYKPKTFGPALQVPHRPGIPDMVVCPSAELVECRLEDIAWARSGDKGNKANIGVLARHPDCLPWIWASLTETVIADQFHAELKGRVERFYLPGTHAMNILMHDALGGGGIASLRNDSQAKSFAQMLLDQSVTLPRSLLDKVQGMRAQ